MIDPDKMSYHGRHGSDEGIIERWVAHNRFTRQDEGYADWVAWLFATNVGQVVCADCVSTNMS